ncbi:alpha/beta hydrolase fold protein [Gloeothece citriformis PCC 7424]|uniref:Alpha/beta hydrolase fold protein n=1 Tax=Gloeothece citriformis (strain PCC 7424) TaxID=65393 RepID=B7KDQ2_GLOC7|nr:alpha/beta fold hydrolase [Gloeothece citriformis]ACK70354.1 alpha/beta hydrolase fold protein [Gloeothece citriformis PCC 7424]
MTIAGDWEHRIGYQRDWVWRGWQIRYAYKRSQFENEKHYPPILLIHGFGAAIEHWRNNIGVLSQRHRVYAIDLLGFGASRKVYTNITVDLWVEQVYDFWRTFIGKPMILVGNSLGSLVSVVAAATHPEMVRGMAMLSLPDFSARAAVLPKWIQPIVDNIERIFSSPIFIKPLFQVLRRPGVIRRWAGIAYYDQKAITDELVAIIATPPLDEGADRTFCLLCQRVSNPDVFPSARTILANLDIPMLLVWGRQDRMIPFKLAPIIASLNPRIKLVELDQMGHCPQDEDPQRFNSILLEWLSTIDNG